METTISCDAFTYFYLLLFGLMFVAMLWLRRGGRSPTRADVRSVGRLLARLDRIEGGLPQSLTGNGTFHTPIKGPDRSLLAFCARQFEEAIEGIRLSTLGSRSRDCK